MTYNNATMEQKPKEGQPGDASASYAPTTLAAATRESNSKTGGTTDVAADDVAADINDDININVNVKQDPDETASATAGGDDGSLETTITPNRNANANPTVTTMQDGTSATATMASVDCTPVADQTTAKPIANDTTAASETKNASLSSQRPTTLATEPISVVAVTALTEGATGTTTETAMEPSRHDETNERVRVSATTIHGEPKTEATSTRTNDNGEHTVFTKRRSDDTTSNTLEFDGGNHNDAKATKKIKLDDLPVSPVQQRRPGDLSRAAHAHPSPVYIATGWPQRSPMEAPPSPQRRRGSLGEEHRCRAESNGSVNASSTTLSSHHTHEEPHDDDNNDDVAHALFTESFDTISACGSALAMAVRGQQINTNVNTNANTNADGSLSPRKVHGPPPEAEGGDMVLQSPRKKSRHGRYNHHGSTNINVPATGTAASYHEYHLMSEKSFSVREENTNNTGSIGQEHQNHGDRQYHEHEHSPHSPPQRVVHVDGDDHGCGDISPIKFSPPTESSPSHDRCGRGHHHRDHQQHRQQHSGYESGLPSNDDVHVQPREGRGFHLETSSPSNDRGREEQQHAAEVSFDTSATGNNSCDQQNSASKRESNDFSVKGIAPRSDHDGRTLGHESNKKKAQDSFIKEEHYDSDRGQHYYHGNKRPFYSTAPPVSRDLPNRGPHYMGHNYYPNTTNHPPIHPTTGEFRSPGTGSDPGGTEKDPSRSHGGGGGPVFKSGKMVQSSPIRSERSPPYPTWPQQELHYPPYGDPANTAPTLPPPPPPHPPYMGASWTGPPPHSDHRSYPPPHARLPAAADNYYPTDQYQRSSGLPSGHAKIMKGTVTVAPPPRDYHQGFHHPHHQHLPIPPPPISSPRPNHQHNPAYTGKDPFNVLRSVRKIFQGCSYLLYPTNMGVNWSGDHQVIHSTDPEDLKIAQRRIESAICALGGYIKDVREGQHYSRNTNASPCSITNNNESSSSAKSSSSTSRSPGAAAAAPMSCYIFRRRDGHRPGRQNSSSIVGTTTWSSSSSDYYRDRFHQRYVIGGHGISWEVEENPPVSVSMDDEDQFVNRGGNSAKNSRSNAGTPGRASSIMGNRKSSQSHPYNGEDDSSSKQPRSSAEMVAPTNAEHDADHTQKMKYRCKLCGQPKQNHVCPYRKSLVRTIGVMVCPSVNAYTSSEPGILTPALTEMNNFVPYGRRYGQHGTTSGVLLDESSDLDTELSPRDHSSSHGNNYRLTPGGAGAGSGNGQKKLTGEHHNNHVAQQHLFSPTTSSLSTSPHSNNQHHHQGRHYQANGWQEKTRSAQQQQSQSAVTSLVLCAEHYRVVTPRTSASTSTAPFRNNNNSSSTKQMEDDRDEKDDPDAVCAAFDYPHVPLTYPGRKRLTDTLFYLSQRIPSAMADVASLLRIARERDEWDLAVAEVLTQVVVCIHCSEGDYRLNGLCSYLLKIGIAS